MRKEILSNGSPKDQRASPLALETIAKRAPNQAEQGINNIDPRIKAIREMTQEQVEQRAGELGLRCKRRIKDIGAMGYTYEERKYKVDRPTQSPLGPWQRIYEGSHINHVQAYREAMVKILELDKQEPQSHLRKDSIDVQNQSSGGSLVAILLGKKYSVSTFTTSNKWETVLQGRFRNRGDARKKAEEEIDRINQKRKS